MIEKLNEKAGTTVIPIFIAEIIGAWQQFIIPGAMSRSIAWCMAHKIMDSGRQQKYQSRQKSNSYSF